MSNLELQSNTPDIYAYGFDENLNANVAKVSSATVYNALDDATNSAQQQSGGNLNLSSLTLSGFSKTVGTADDLQAAINAVHAAGGGTVLLQAGTYTIRTPLVGYSSVSIQGISSNATILDFQGSSNLTLAGSDVYTTGTISSIAFGVQVTGNGTSWSSSMNGKQIFINNRWYIIANVTGATTLTLASGYADGATYSGTYRIANVIKNVKLAGLLIKDSGSTALVATDVRDLVQEDLSFTNNNKGFVITNFMNLDFDRVVVASSVSNGYELANGSFCNVNAGLASVSNGGHGADINNVKSSGWILSACDANTLNGFNLTSVTNCTFQVEAAGNGGKGIEEVSGCSGNSYASGSIINANTSDGIKLTASSNNDNIGADIQITNNGGWGINIANANCNNNTIIVPYFSNNASGNVNDLGTGTNQVLTSGTANSQAFTSNGTWTKPTSANVVMVVAYGGGGGGGGGGLNTSYQGGGGGGGGGQRVQRIFKASDLAATISIVVGTGGPGGAAGSNNGTNGGDSTFGSTLVVAKGGSGGTNGNASGGTGAGGGAGGGWFTAPSATAAFATQGASGGLGSTNANRTGNASEEGGAGGGAGGIDSAHLSANGGDTIYAGAGGGGGGGDGGLSLRSGSPGGGLGQYSSGHGGAGGAGSNPGTAGSPGTDGDSTKGGTGGGGGGSSFTNTAGGIGGNGGACGGGAGGGGASGGGTTGGSGGTGGAGRIYVFSW